MNKPRRLLTLAFAALFLSGCVISIDGDWEDDEHWAKRQRENREAIADLSLACAARPSKNAWARRISSKHSCAGQTNSRCCTTAPIALTVTARLRVMKRPRSCLSAAISLAGATPRSSSL